MFHIIMVGLKGVVAFELEISPVCENEIGPLVVRAVEAKVSMGLIWV